MTTYSDQLFHFGGVPVPVGGFTGSVGRSAMPQKVFYVDGNNGSDSNEIAVLQNGVDQLDHGYLVAG